MYLDAQPLMGFGFAGLGALLDDAQETDAIRYNAKAANTIWTTPHLGAIIDRYSAFVLAQIIAAYQKTKGLKVDGKLGPRTAASIEASAKGVSSGYDASGSILDSVEEALDMSGGDPTPGTWNYAFENDEEVGDPEFREGMRVFHNFKVVKSLPKPQPNPQPNPFPIPPVKQAGLGSAAYFTLGGVLLFLAYRSAMGKPLNPFGK